MLRLETRFTTHLSIHPSLSTTKKSCVTEAANQVSNRKTKPNDQLTNFYD